MNNYGRKNVYGILRGFNLHLGQRDDLSAYVDDWINAAYLTLTTQSRFWGLKRDFYFPELETSSSANTVDGTNYVAIPTDALVIRSVFDTTSTTKLRNMAQSKFLEYTDRADTTAESNPTEWIRQGAYIYLHPTPDAVYALTIHYRKRPALLTGSAVTVIGANGMSLSCFWLRRNRGSDYKRMTDTR